MEHLIKQKLLRAFGLTTDLIKSLDETSLNLKLGDLSSNTIGDQIWCIVGARESYTTAMRAGSWQGFACSLKDKFNKDAVIKSVDTTQMDLENLSFENFRFAQLNIALDLLEHEIQHHGQLIRYVYGNKLKFPKTWHDRYTV